MDSRGGNEADEHQHLIEYANAQGMVTVGMTGFSGGKLKEIVAHPVHIPVDDYGMAENMHMIIVHIVITRTTEVIRQTG